MGSFAIVLTKRNFSKISRSIKSIDFSDVNIEGPEFNSSAPDAGINLPNEDISSFTSEESGDIFQDKDLFKY